MTWFSNITLLSILLSAFQSMFVMPDNSPIRVGEKNQGKELGRRGREGGSGPLCRGDGGRAYTTVYWSAGLRTAKLTGYMYSVRSSKSQVPILHDTHPVSLPPPAKLLNVRCLKHIDSSVERLVGKHWPGTVTMAMQLAGWCGCTSSGSVVGNVTWTLFAGIERYWRLFGPGVS